MTHTIKRTLLWTIAMAAAIVAACAAICLALPAGAYAADGSVVRESPGSTQVAAQAKSPVLQKKYGGYWADLSRAKASISGNYLVVKGEMLYSRHYDENGLKSKTLKGTFKFKLGKKCNYFVESDALGKKGKKLATSHPLEGVYDFNKASFKKLLAKRQLKMLLVIVKGGKVVNAGFHYDPAY